MHSITVLQYYSNIISYYLNLFSFSLCRISALAPLWPTFHFRSVMFYQVSMIYCSCSKADDNISWMISSNIYDSWYKSTAFPLTLCWHEHRPVETSKTMPFFSGSISRCSGFVESQNRVPVEFFSLQKASPCRCSSASLSLAVWHSSPMDPAPYSWQISMKEWRNMKDREWYSDDLPMDQGGMWAGFLKTPCLHDRGSFAPLPTLWIKSELPLT